MNWEYEDIPLFAEIPDVEKSSINVNAVPTDCEGGACVQAYDGENNPVVVFLDRARVRLLMLELEAIVFPESVAAERVRTGALHDMVEELNGAQD